MCVTDTCSTNVRPTGTIPYITSLDLAKRQGSVYGRNKKLVSPSKLSTSLPLSLPPSFSQPTLLHYYIPTVRYLPLQHPHYFQIIIFFFTSILLLLTVFYAKRKKKHSLHLLQSPYSQKTKPWLKSSIRNPHVSKTRPHPNALCG